MEIAQAYKFCPRCDSSFSKKKGYLACANCGLSYYLNPKPCTAVILVNDKGEYLLVERAVDPAKGYWDLPGGFVEENETLEENVRREVEEELGIKVSDLNYIGSVTEPYLFQNIIYQTIAATFIAKFPAGVKPEPADDVAGYKFFARDKLPLDKLAFATMKKDFDTAAKFLKNNKL